MKRPWGRDVHGGKHLMLGGFSPKRNVKGRSRAGCTAWGVFGTKEKGGGGGGLGWIMGFVVTYRVVDWCALSLGEGPSWWI